MRVTFVGVGEAFDENLANTSVLVDFDSSTVLLDCGFTAASAFWRVAEKPLELDALYITHFHGDHYFGVPALLVRSIEEGRTKPLTILGQTGVGDRIPQLMEMAYRGTMAKAAFEISYIECDPISDFEHAGFRFRFAINDHPMPSLSVRLDAGGRSVFYSGDGRPTAETLALATGVDLVVHESFSLEPDKPGHGTVDSSIDFAKKAGAGKLALVHVQRGVRRDRENEILTRADASDVPTILPEPGEVCSVEK